MLQVIGTFIVCGLIFILTLYLTIRDHNQREKIHKLEFELETLKRLERIRKENKLD